MIDIDAEAEKLAEDVILKCFSPYGHISLHGLKYDAAIEWLFPIIKSFAERIAQETRKEALEECINLKDAFIKSDYGTSWDKGLEHGMNSYQQAIRGLKELS